MKTANYIFIFIVSMLAFSFLAEAQKLYDEKVDGNVLLNNAIEKAKKENKYVIAMVGGNWCKWCLMFNEFATTNDTISKIIDDNFIMVHINYAKQGSNNEVMKRLGYPQRFGFPVFVVLNDEGERIHTQNSAYLEQGNAYSTKEVARFLNHWTKRAVTIGS